MSDQRDTVEFGAPMAYGSHVFRVEIPALRTGAVRIIEDYGYAGGDGGLPYEEERALIPRSIWSKIADSARRDFNDRLRPKNVATGRWRSGKNLLDRMLGRELCVLAWAAEHAKADEITIVCTKWSALRPEERWWLFSMTAAEAGLADDSERGWRRALYFALSDGKSPDASLKRRRVDEADHITSPLF